VDIPIQGSGNTVGRSLNEACGVIALAETVPVSYRIIQSLRIIQHRGQESAGIAIFSNGKTKVHKGMGLVNEVFSGKKIEDDGLKGIGHIRYSTAGSSVIENAQPLFARIKNLEITIGHNGEISNAADIKSKLEDSGYSFQTNSDTEVILKLLSIELSKNQDFIESMKKAFRNLIGAYSLVIGINDRIFAVRDPNAIRPLSVGKTKYGYGAASEDIVFYQLGGYPVRDVKQGEIVEITQEGIKSFIYEGRTKPAHCMFEYVYFSRPDSTLDGKNVFAVRRQIGRILARENPVEADYVVPVPDSGRSHALGYSEESRIPLVEGLIKNRYVDRTFIMPEQDGRRNELDIKLNPINEIVEGKRLILVDDSIIRGNTMRKIVNQLRDRGAREVHVRIGSPPIVSPCYLGIDMKTRTQFIASGKSVEEISKTIEADSLHYISLNGLIEAIGLGEENLCLGCLTGIYPVKIKDEKFRGY
jgi:amidophosphoribosyltransferase